MLTANAEGLIESEGSIRKVLVRRVFRHPPIDMGPRRLPSARTEDVFGKKCARLPQVQPDAVKLVHHTLPVDFLTMVFMLIGKSFALEVI